MATLYTFPNIIPTSNTWQLKTNTHIFTSPLSNATQVLELPGARWAATLKFDDLEDVEKRVLYSFLAKMRGAANQFKLYDHSYAGPQGDVGGTPVCEAQIHLTNTGFDTDTDWTKGTGWTIANGVADCDGTQTANSALTQTIGAGLLASGYPYKIQFDLVTFTAGSIWGTAGQNTTQAITYDANAVQTGLTYNFEVASLNTQSDTNRVIGVEADADFVGSIDNLRIWLRSDYILTTGWTATNTTTILYAGEYLEVETSELKLVAEDIVSDGSGTAVIHVEPPMHTVRIAQSNINTTNPTGKFRLIDDEQVKWTNKGAGIISDTEFSCVEVI
jgi:hypothetical protein